MLRPWDPRRAAQNEEKTASLGGLLFALGIEPDACRVVVLVGDLVTIHHLASDGLAVGSCLTHQLAVGVIKSLMGFVDVAVEVVDVSFHRCYLLSFCTLIIAQGWRFVKY